jgi:hypothetical protein
MSAEQQHDAPKVEEQVVQANDYGNKTNEWNVTNENRQEEFHTNICVWEQIIDAYLQFTGILAGTGGIVTKTLQFDRSFRFTAQENTLIVQAQDPNATQYFSFNTSVVVTQPIITPTKRITNCNQFVRIIEHPVFIDISPYESALIPVNSLIIAENGQVAVYAITEPLASPVTTVPSTAVLITRQQAVFSRPTGSGAIAVAAAPVPPITTAPPPPPIGVR